MGSSTKGGKSAYYSCRRRRYYGPNTEGGCDSPNIKADTLHDIFWDQILNLLNNPKTINTLWSQCQHILAEKTKTKQRDASPKKHLQKLGQDIQRWFERHDSATNDLEKEAAWRRILELTQQHTSLKDEAEKPTPTIRPPKMSKKKIATYLSKLREFVKLDRSKPLMLSLVENHNLTAHITDDSTIILKMGLLLPNQEFIVPIEQEAYLPTDKITAWMVKNQGQHTCSCGCNQTIKIIRKHYWSGVPDLHSTCGHKGMQRKRQSPAKGYYNGQQAADALGIGRTTLNRWIAKGKAPKPCKSISGTLLFSKKAIDKLAADHATQLSRWIHLHHPLCSKLGEVFVSDGLLDLFEEVGEKVQVVNRHECRAQHFMRHEKMPDGTARIISASVATAVFVNGVSVKLMFCISQPDSPIPRKRLSISAVAGRQHTIEHIHTASDSGENIPWFTHAHEVSRF